MPKVGLPASPHTEQQLKEERVEQQHRDDRTATAPVVIGIDPHKASWTAAAVNSALQPLATIRVPVSRTGYRRLREFAAQWPAATWAIEEPGAWAHR